MADEHRSVLTWQSGTVVDWDAIGGGNGDFDLITLRFDLAGLLDAHVPAPRRRVSVGLL